MDVKDRILNKMKNLTEAKNQYRYGMVNRPVGGGTAPAGWVAVEDRPKDKKHPLYELARHGILVYDRELTEAEVTNFELAYLPKNDDVIVAKVAKALGKYAKRVFDLAQKDRKTAEGAIMQKAEKEKFGRYLVLVEPDKFMDKVLKAIK